MRIRRFGRFLSVIVEPAARPDPTSEDEPGGDQEPATGEVAGPWFDHWTNHDGRFLRFGRMLVVYTPRPARSGTSGAT